MKKVDIYKKNQQKVKTIAILTPIIFWVLIGLSIICLISSVKNSIGNIVEISDLLDSQKYNGEQLKNNYSYLVEKYGEWVIGSGSNGFTLVFINIKNAMFSGFAIFNGIMFIVFLLSAFILGKWLLPFWGKQIEQQNQDMVNITILSKE